jgi:hypothetical protein
MKTADQVIRWSTALAVGVAAVAAVASYEHASALVEAHGESGWAWRPIPLTIDGFIYADADGDAGFGTAECSGACTGAVTP